MDSSNQRIFVWRVSIRSSMLSTVTVKMSNFKSILELNQSRFENGPFICHPDRININLPLIKAVEHYCASLTTQWLMLSYVAGICVVFTIANILLTVCIVRVGGLTVWYLKSSIFLVSSMSLNGWMGWNEMGWNEMRWDGMDGRIKYACCCYLNKPNPCLKKGRRTNCCCNNNQS